MTEDSFNLGVIYAASQYGLTKGQVMAKKAANKILDTSIEKQQLYSKAGVDILKQAGMQDTIECKVLEKCASFPRLLNKTAYKLLVKPVETALIKSAITGKDAAGTILGMSSEAASAILLSALTLGGIGGAGIWGIRKATADEEAETSAKFQQALKYKQIAREIQDEMRLQRKQDKTSNINSRNQVVNTSHTANTAQDYQF